MSKSVKLIAVVIISFIILFATSFLLDLQIIKINLVRQILVYLLIIVEFVLGFNIGKQIAVKQN